MPARRATVEAVDQDLDEASARRRDSDKAPEKGKGSIAYRLQHLTDEVKAGSIARRKLVSQMDGEFSSLNRRVDGVASDVKTIGGQVDTLCDQLSPVVMLMVILSFFGKIVQKVEKKPKMTVFLVIIIYALVTEGIPGAGMVLRHWLNMMLAGGGS